jgi:hypothetical protein
MKRIIDALACLLLTTAVAGIALAPFIPMADGVFDPWDKATPSVSVFDRLSDPFVVGLSSQFCRI